MTIKQYLAALALGVVTLTAAEPGVQLTTQGVEFQSGTLLLVLPYPKLESKDGKRDTPQITVQSPQSATLKYSDGGAAELTLTADGGTYAFTGRKGESPYFEIMIPLNYADGGKWAIDGKTGEFPKLPEENNVLFGGNGKTFTLTSPTQESLTLEMSGYFQLQDNRKWKWNIYALQYKGHLADEKLSFRWKFAQAAEKSPPLVDRYGQSTRVDYPAKVRSDAELKADVAADLAYYASLNPPARDQWGGAPGTGQKYQLKATGFFRVDTLNGRRVMVDPDGNLFFQLGVCMIGNCDDYTLVSGREKVYEWIPDQDGEYDTAFLKNQSGKIVSYYIVNYIRKTGKPYNTDDWQRQMFGRLRKWGFNSHGAFGDNRPANEDLNMASCPGLINQWKPWKKTATDIIDPFDAGNIALMDRDFAAALPGRADNPNIIGYFSGNEQHYTGTAQAVLRDGDSAAKREFLKILQDKYPAIAGFNQNWGTGATNWEELVNTPLHPKTDAAFADAETLEKHFFDAYFKLIADTFHQYDSHHLYLGERFLPAMMSNRAAVEACAKYSDVFSVNYYTPELDRAWLDQIAAAVNRPIILSEWSYGSAEQGQFGVVNKKDEAERGLYYRRYVENAAAHPAVVGVQWFACLDQSLTGRWFQKYNGESMNIGLVNVADRPYKTFLDAVAQSNYLVYPLILSEQKPIALAGTVKNENKLLQIPRILTGNRIDGDFKDWPNRPGEPIRRSVDGKQPAAGDTGDFWCAWDDQNLYVYAVINDATPAVNPNRDTLLWSADAVELFLGTALDSPGGFRFGDRQLIVGMSPEPKYQWYNSVAMSPVKAVTVIAPDQKSYRVEMAIPWKELNITPKTGMKLRFDLGIDFGSPDGTRLNQLMWNGGRDNSSVRQNWGTAVLVN